MRRPRRDRPLAVVSLASYPCLLRGVAVCYTRVTFFGSVGAPFRPEVRHEADASTRFPATISDRLWPRILVSPSKNGLITGTFVNLAGDLAIPGNLGISSGTPGGGPHDSDR